MKQIKIAIDPGKTGALAVRYPEGTVDVFKYKSEADMRDSLAEIKRYASTEKYRLSAVLEKVRSSPQQGVTSAFTFGWNYGFWRGLLQAYRISFREVRPQDWQKGLVPAKKQKGERKHALKQIAEERFPELKVTLATADALLMLDNA
jgi:hypothetical protein